MKKEREKVLETSILARSILYKHFTKFFVFKSIYNIYKTYIKRKKTEPKLIRIE